MNDINRHHGLKTEGIRPIPEDLEHPDTDGIQKTLLSQLKQAGIATPNEVDLFPAHLHPRQAELANDTSIKDAAKKQAAEEGFMDPNTKTIIGVSPEGELNKMLGAAPHRAGCQCYLHQHFGANRLFVALHETTHYVDDQLGLNQKIFAVMKQKNPDIRSDDLVLQSNIRERIADSSAAVYILSNYGDNAQSRKLIQSVTGMRLSNLETTHFSTSSVDAAVEAFRKNPKHGMSIVETTKMAANIVGKQAGLSDDIEAANNVNFERDTKEPAPTVNPDNILFDKKSAVATAKLKERSASASSLYCNFPGK